MRVGEITRLNISDMNFQERSCIFWVKVIANEKFILVQRVKCI